jgi:peptidoglycan/LPS O-acetylase OafA/YrhL
MPTSSAAALPAPRAPRYHSLDFWRGAACLLVLLNHSVWYLPRPSGDLSSTIAQVALRCWAGVPIFFLISGYCIAAACDSHRRKDIPVRTYFWKRFRRIYPPYWIVLLAAAAAVGAGDLLLNGAVTKVQMFRPWWFSSWQWAGSITLTELWRYHWIGDGKGLFLGHAWTLCYEEQFYAVTGVLLLICARRFFAGVTVTTLLVAAVLACSKARGAHIDGFFFDGSWFQFAMGIAVYYALNYGGRLVYTATLVGFFLVALAAVVRFGQGLLLPDKNDAQVYLVASVFGIVAMLLRPRDAAIGSSRWLMPISACGVMCYSLYLVHFPVTKLVESIVRAIGVTPATVSPFVSISLCAVPSLMLSTYFHRSIERRFMNPQVDERTPQHRPAGAPRGVAASLLSGGAV